MGVELDIYVVSCYQVILHSRIGKINGIKNTKNEITFEDIKRIDDDKPSIIHPAGFSNHVFNPDNNETGYLNYSFDPNKTETPYGEKPIISTITETLSHFNKMQTQQIFWKQHTGFIRTKKMIEILYQSLYFDQHNEPDIIIKHSDSSESQIIRHSELDKSNSNQSIDLHDILYDNKNYDFSKSNIKNDIDKNYRVIFWFY